MKPKVDILLATYNASDFITEQLQSILNQTYQNFEIIIRDDCSKDRTIELIEQFQTKYPNKIKLIKGTQNLGALGNFSALCHESTANYIMFSDNDDVWLPTKIENSLKQLLINESLYGSEKPLLVHTDLKVVDRKLNILDHSFWNYSRIDPHAISINRLLIQNVVTGCTAIINKSLLKLAVPIPKEALMHDWWIALVASAFGHIDVIPQASILYRQHGKNVIGAKNWRTYGTYWAHAKKCFSYKGREEIQHRLKKTIDQSALFLSRYGDNLTNDKKFVVEQFASIRLKNFLHKRYLFLRFGFFKSSFIKNVGTFLFI